MYCAITGGDGGKKVEQLDLRLRRMMMASAIGRFTEWVGVNNRCPVFDMYMYKQRHDPIIGHEK